MDPTGRGRATELIGAELAFGWTDLGGLVIAAAGDEYGSLRWEKTPLARGEIAGEVWTVAGSGLRPLRVLVGRRGRDLPDLIYAGTLTRGLARSRPGHAYQLDRSWEGGRTAAWILHDSGASVVEMTVPWGSTGNPLLLASIAPRVPQGDDVAPLLLLVGFLKMARFRCPWIFWTTLGLPDRAIERTMTSIVRQAT